MTGGAGFLGSHLCERLLAQGDEVICVDNLFTGDKRNVREFFDHECFEFIRHDVTFPLYIEVDQIYNLACPASPIQYQRNPIQTVKTNVHGAINMLGLAKRTGAKVLQASTSEVYGDPDVHPQPEDYHGRVNPIGVRACYDEGKRCAETLFSDYKRQEGVETKIARIFNTYGPKMDVGDGRVVSNFIVQALRGDPMTIFGDGSQTRSFCYVSDTIEGLIRLMSRDVSVPVNIGSEEEITVSELAGMIREVTSSRSEVVKLDGLEDDPMKRRPVTTRALELLEWRPIVSMKQGLASTAEYFEKIVS